MQDTYSGPMKECSAVSCHKLIPYDQRHCSEHKEDGRKAYDKHRNKRDKKLRKIYHSTRWRKLRVQILLRDEYMCQECVRKGLYTNADVVDHIVELRDNINKAYDIKNLESLCHACHNAKTIREKNNRERGPLRF